MILDEFTRKGSEMKRRGFFGAIVGLIITPWGKVVSILSPELPKLFYGPGVTEIIDMGLLNEATRKHFILVLRNHLYESTTLFTLLTKRSHYYG